MSASAPKRPYLESKPTEALRDDVTGKEGGSVTMPSLNSPRERLAYPQSSQSMPSLEVVSAASFGSYIEFIVPTGCVAPSIAALS